MCLSGLGGYRVFYSELEPIIATGDPDCDILRPHDATQITPDIAIDAASDASMEGCISGA